MYADVSVIIPCHNSAKTINRALDSVVNQSLAPREVIVVDDGSDDDTHDLIQNHPINNTGIRTILLSNRSNKGPAYSRNKAWEKSSRAYIAFLDADDWWHPQKMEIQYNWIKDKPDFYLCGHKYLVPLNNEPPENPYLFEPSGLLRYQKISSFKILLKNYFSTPTVMVRAEIPFRFPENQRRSEDYYMWLKIILTKHNAAFLSAPLTFLGKEATGAGGLSKDFYLMEKGELETFRRLYKEGFLGLPVYFFCTVFSRVKYFRRIIYHVFKKSERLHGFSFF